MSDIKSIKVKQQTLARLERKYALERVKARKKDTRRKIELGGLVIKAKIHHYPKDIILGALIDALFQIETDEATYKLFKLKGQAAFMNFGDKKHG